MMTAHWVEGGGAGAAGRGRDRDGGLDPLQDHRAHLLPGRAVGLARGDHDGVRALAQGEGRAHRHRLLRAPLLLLMHLGPVQRDRDPADALARARDRRDHARLVGHAGAVLRVAHVHRERHQLLVMDRAHLLVHRAVGLGGGDHEGVLALGQLDREVHRHGGLLGAIVLAPELHAVGGDEDLPHAGAAVDDGRERHRLLVHARLVRGRRDRDAERGRRLAVTRAAGPRPPAGARARAARARPRRAGESARAAARRPDGSAEAAWARAALGPGRGAAGRAVGSRRPVAPGLAPVAGWPLPAARAQGWAAGGRRRPPGAWPCGAAGAGGAGATAGGGVALAGGGVGRRGRGRRGRGRRPPRARACRRRARALPGG